MTILEIAFDLLGDRFNEYFLVFFTSLLQLTPNVPPLLPSAPNWVGEW